MKTVNPLVFQKTLFRFFNARFGLKTACTTSQIACLYIRIRTCTQSTRTKMNDDNVSNKAASKSASATMRFKNSIQSTNNLK